MKRFLIGFLTLAALGGACQVEAVAGQVTLDISYSGSNLGVSGSGVLQAIDEGNGEYEAVSGYLNATLAGLPGTVYETLVPNTNFPGTSVFENSNGDEPVYDNVVFAPYNAPASTDGAQLTYAGGLMFQTAAPSTEDVYLSAASQGTFGGYYYFAGWSSQGILGDGSLSNLSITLAPSSDVGTASVPEPSSMILASIAAVCAGAFALVRNRKIASV